MERAINQVNSRIDDASSFEEVSFEGYGPGGIAYYIEAPTDNNNRTAVEVRHIFTKHGGNMGTNGSVSYLFEQKGMIGVPGRA